MLRIAELTAFRVRIPLKKTIRHASYTRTSTDSVVVCCQLSDGTEGWGEGLPREYVTGETADSAFELLEATPLLSQLGESVANLPSVIEICRGLQISRPEPDPRDCFGNSVRCAVELSVLDACCRAFDVPLRDVASSFAIAAGIRERREEVQYSAAITSMSAFKQRIRAWLIRVYGFHQAKVKTGVDGIDDVASLGRIRGCLGNGIDIRIDANEAWDCETLEQTMVPLTPFGISSLEQPVPHKEVEGLAAIRPNLSVPIMLDESLCSLADARLAIEAQYCDLFNIRLSKVGGFLNAMQIAAAAHQAGLGYQLGCQVGETGILSAAGRHFATSIGSLRYVEGSYERFLVRERLTVEDLTFGYGGRAPALEGPGLGVTVDRRALERVTLQRRSFLIQR